MYKLGDHLTFNKIDPIIRHFSVTHNDEQQKNEMEKDISSNFLSSWENKQVDQPIRIIDHRVARAASSQKPFSPGKPVRHGSILSRTGAYGGRTEGGERKIEVVNVATEVSGKDIKRRHASTRNDSTPYGIAFFRSNSHAPRRLLLQEHRFHACRLF